MAHMYLLWFDVLVVKMDFICEWSSGHHVKNSQSYLEPKLPFHTM